MGFFDGLPAPGPPEPPGCIIGGSCRGRNSQALRRPVPLVLARPEQVAVAITAMSAYTAGFEIFVTARIRPGGHSGPAGREPAAPWDLAVARRSFRFGLQLSDGSKVIGHHGGRRPDPAWCRTPLAAARALDYRGGGRGRCRRAGRWSSSASGPRSGPPRPGPGRRAAQCPAMARRRGLTATGRAVAASVSLPSRGLGRLLP